MGINLCWIKRKDWICIVWFRNFVNKYLRMLGVKNRVFVIKKIVDIFKKFYNWNIFLLWLKIILVECCFGFLFIKKFNSVELIEYWVNLFLVLD